MIRGDGGGTGGGRAGAAEIAWEEARDGGGRSKGMMVGRVVDGLGLRGWLGRSRNSREIEGDDPVGWAVDGLEL